MRAFRRELDIEVIGIIGARCAVMMPATRSDEHEDDECAHAGLIVAQARPGRRDVPRRLGHHRHVPTKKTTAKAAAKKKPTAKAATKKATTKAAAKRPPTRKDLGAPIDSFFTKQPPALKAILVELRTIIEAEVPEATSSIKWGNPFFSLDGEMMAAISAHKAHVNLILAGPPGAFADPNGRLEGEGKTGRHLKLTSIDQLPRVEVRGWVKTAAKIARAK